MSDVPAADEPLELVDIERCFGGAVPGVIATAGADGMPNVTYLTRAHRVDADRIALSNQFMSKTARNLATNPRASLLLLDPVTYAEYRLALVYERTERRGHVFERLRTDVEAIAALEGMQDVFRLRAADIFRVVDIAVVPAHPSGRPPAPSTWPRHRTAGLGALAELSTRIGRCTDLDVLVDTALDGLDQLLGFPHNHLLLLDEAGGTLYTIGSTGFDAASIGAEVPVGDGVIGAAAARCEPVRIGALQQMAKYSRSVRRTFEDRGGVRPGREVPMPGLPHAESRLAVPAMARGELIGVLAVDSSSPVAFNDTDQQTLSIVANALASAIEHIRALEPDDDPPAGPTVGHRLPIRTTRRRWCATSPSMAASSSAPTTSSRAWPVGSSGRCSATTSPTAAWTSATRSCASTRRSICPASRTTSRAGSSC